MQVELENRMHSLTQSLLSKQNNLETITAERNALKLQLEKITVSSRLDHSDLFKLNRSKIDSINIKKWSFKCDNNDRKSSTSTRPTMRSSSCQTSWCSTHSTRGCRDASSEPIRILISSACVWGSSYVAIHSPESFRCSTWRCCISLLYLFYCRRHPHNDKSRF